ncbi:hypothetical protein SBA6_270020 [Candidatus Sulfopaludibacter sp. SbA6]|nr:hypothetical protein SBA6_270020 [Candidatus Sulfopaludibacter sp. SbA6]
MNTHSVSLILWRRTSISGTGGVLLTEANSGGGGTGQPRLCYPSKGTAARALTQPRI